MFADLGIKQGLPVSLELSERALLVGTHQPAVAGHIGRQDGCEPSFYAFRGQGCLRRDKSGTAYPSHPHRTT